MRQLDLLPSGRRQLVERGMGIGNGHLAGRGDAQRQISKLNGGKSSRQYRNTALARTDIPLQRMLECLIVFRTGRAWPRAASQRRARQ